MATLQSIAELAWRQIFPRPSDETNITKSEFIETAKTEYAYQLWLLNRQELRDAGENNIPANLLSTTTLTVTDKKADISTLKALRSLPNNTWIQLLGGIECGKCKYVVMDVNLWKLLCDDDSRIPGDKAVVVIGNQFYFPEGTFETNGQVDLTYANTGTTVNNLVEVEDAVGGIVRRALIDIYGKKFVADKTNNSNGNG